MQTHLMSQSDPCHMSRPVRPDRSSRSAIRTAQVRRLHSCGMPSNRSRRRITGQAICPWDGDRRGQQAQRAGSADAPMRPADVVELFELPQSLEELVSAPDRDRSRHPRCRICTHPSKARFIPGISMPPRTPPTPASLRTASNRSGSLPLRPRIRKALPRGAGSTSYDGGATSLRHDGAHRCADTHP